MTLSVALSIYHHKDQNMLVTTHSKSYKKNYSDFAMMQRTYVLIFGDFNARTSELQDYVRIDEYLSDLYGLEEMYNENTSIFECLDLHDIPLNRKS